MLRRLSVVIAVSLVSSFAWAQAPQRLTADDEAAIRELVASYAKNLFGCQPQAFADLFVPETGYFASGFRGHIVGHAGLAALVESERHCLAPANGGQATRPGGAAGPTVVIEPTASGARGVADLGNAGGYQDEYAKTPQGWKFAARTVITPAEKAAGLDAAGMLAIHKLGGPDLADNYAPDQNGVQRLRTSGVAVTVKDGVVTGRGFTKDGGYNDDVYEKVGGEWRVKSRTHVPAAAAAGKGAVLGTGTFTSFVENMDRSLAFYHDAFGMEVPPLPESGARRYNPTNLQLFAMFDIQGARERHQSAQIKGTNVHVELMEVQDVPHKTVPLRIQDPGAASLVLVVRDVGETLANVKRAGGKVVTPHGKPVKLADGGEAVLVQDLDGRFIELVSPAARETTAANAVSEQRLSIAVADLARTLHVYRDVLGFTVDAETPFAADRDVRALTGLAKAEVRRARVHAAGSSLPIEFVEYRGVDRKPLSFKIQDRGAARLQLRAANLDDLVATMKQAGLKVVSEGGVAVPIPPNFKGALVADLDGFFLTPFAPCDGCAPRLISTPGQAAGSAPAAGAAH